MPAPCRPVVAPCLAALAAAAAALPLHARQEPGPRAEDTPPEQGTSRGETIEPPPWAASGPEGDVLPGDSLQTIVITPTGGATTRFEAPYTVQTVPAELIERRSYRTSPQALRDVPGVLVQETGHGQGSPFLRGFTGFRTLLLVDGIRVNNSVFRDGPNQYWNTVDPLSVETFEVVKGPSSVLYGSDAIGGTVNAITRNPWAWGDDPFGARYYHRVSSAESSHVVRGEVSGSFDDTTGVLAGITRKDFGNLEGGEDIGLQPNTGYEEWDGDFKVEHFFGASTRLVVAHQRVDQNDAPRTHQTDQAVSFAGTTIGSDRRRDLDQDRRLTYVQLHADDLDGWADAARVSLSWHEQEEQRDRIRSNGNRELQGFDVGTLGLWAQLEKATDAGTWSWGFDAYHDRVDSFLTDLSDPGNAADGIQGPVADEATYDRVGLFVQDEIEATDRLTLILGARYEYAAADADEVRDPVTDAQISIDDSWDAVVGSARFRYELDPEWNLFGGVSQGFRAPNLSDLTRFDTARTDEFEIPAPGLEPEHFLSFELGAKASLDDLALQTAAFYTDVEDQIIRFPTGNANAAGEVEVTKDNIGDGHIWGLEAGASYRVAPQWTVFGNSAYLDGEVSTFPTSAQVLVDEPPSRLMPWTSQVGVGWEEPGGEWWAEALVVHAADADELSTRDEGDTGRIPPGGTPGYTVGSLRAGWRPTERVELVGGLENVTDEDYRVHGSGQNMPGRSLAFSVRLTL